MYGIIVAPPTLQQYRFWRILIATWICYACYSMLRRPLSVVRAPMIADNALTMHESSMIDTSYLIMYTAGQLWYPSIRARIPGASRFILAAGLGLSGLAAALFAVTNSATLVSSPSASFLVRCLLWGFMGLTQAVGWASCLVVLTPWLEPRERGSIMGVWSTNMAVGGAIGNTVAASVLAQNGGHWASVFVVMGLLGVAVAAALACTMGPHPNAVNIRTAAQQEKAQELPETAFESILSGQTDVEGEWVLQDDNNTSSKQRVMSPAAAAVTTTTTTTSATDSSGAKPAEVHVAFLPGMNGIACSYFFHKLVRYVLMFWLPYYLTTALKFDATVAGMVATSLDFGGIAGTVGAGIVSDRLGGGKRKALTVSLLGAGMLVSLCGFAAGVAHAGMVPTLVLCFLCGACAFGLDSLLTGSLLQDHCEKVGAPHRIGAVGAFVGGVGTLGSMFQGPFAVIVSSYSWTWMFVAMMAMTGAAMVALIPVVRTETRISEAAVRENAD